MTGYVADLSWKSGARAIEKLDRLSVDAGDFKHELLNRLRSTMAVNVLTTRITGYKTRKSYCCLSVHKSSKTSFVLFFVLTV